MDSVRHGDSARSELNAVEVDRAIVVQTVAETLNLEHNVTLRQLAGRLPAPWAEVFHHHHAAFLDIGEPLPRSLADFLR